MIFDDEDLLLARQVFSPEQKDDNDQEEIGLRIPDKEYEDCICSGCRWICVVCNPPSPVDEGSCAFHNHTGKEIRDAQKSPSVKVDFVDGLGTAPCPVCNPRKGSIS